MTERDIEVASGRWFVAERRRRVLGRDTTFSGGEFRMATTDSLVAVETFVVASWKSLFFGGDGRVRRWRSDLAALERDEFRRD